MIQQLFQKVYQKQDLSPEEARQAIHLIMSGSVTPVQIAAFLTALHLKGETEAEITSFAEGMREKADGYKYDGDLLDTCGTGGDKKGIFNVSTAVAIVVSSCQVTVAKHGNRAVSSSSGSADILKSLGANIELETSQVAQALERLHLGFLFAQTFHPAMRYVAPVRKELGVRTIFNILGPLANPLHANSQLMGIFDFDLLTVMIGVLRNMGLKNAMVVHSRDGFDEISIFAETDAYYFQSNGPTRHLVINPADFGLRYASSALADIIVTDEYQAKSVFTGAIRGVNSAARDMVILNAAYALWLVGKVENPAQGMRLASDMIQSGAAAAQMENYIHITRELSA